MNVKHYRLNIHWIAFYAIIAALAIASGVMLTQAQEEDGRINGAHHLGGDVVYCIGADGAATNDAGNNGIRLLNAQGDILLDVSPQELAEAPEFPLVNTVIAEGPGSHGVVTLSRLTNGQLQLDGVDEHGNAFKFAWTACEQVNPIPQPDDVDDASDSDEGDNNDGDEPVGEPKPVLCDGLEGDELAYCTEVEADALAYCDYFEVSVADCWEFYTRPI